MYVCVSVCVRYHYDYVSDSRSHVKASEIQFVR